MSAVELVSMPDHASRLSRMSSTYRARLRRLMFLSHSHDSHFFKLGFDDDKIEKSTNQPTSFIKCARAHFIGKLYSEEELAIRCSRAGSGSHLMRNRKPGTGILDMPSQSDYTQLRTSEQSTSLNDEYHQSDSINDAPFGPDLRFIDTTLKQVAFAEVYVQVAQFVSKLYTTYVYSKYYRAS